MARRRSRAVRSIGRRWPAIAVAVVLALGCLGRAEATTLAPSSTGNTGSPDTTLTSTTTPGPPGPLRVSANGRYLVDQSGAPFLIVGDSPQALIGNLTETQANAFFADRQAEGFNTEWINLLCADYTGCHSDGTTFDGLKPFSTGGSPSDYDLATPNPSYFQRVDEMINLAAQHGQTVFLDPIETGSWLTTLRNNGTTKAFTYGAYLGNRYMSFPNIVWMSGNDFQSWSNSTDANLVLAVMQGIQSVDTVHVQTVELAYNVSSSLDSSILAPLVTLNAAYTYYPTYAEVLHAYNQSSSAPTFMVESNYEFENNTGNDPSTPALLRQQEYWTMLSGATGQFYGNHYTWSFTTGWENNLDTVGATQLGYQTRLLTSLPWYQLVPDQNHAVLTAGYGTFTDTGPVHTNDYATAARTPDGSVVMVYMPTSRTITIDMSKLAGTVTARWFDPTDGTSTTASGSPFANSGSRQFTPPGANAEGSGDWVLLLQVTPVPAVSPASVNFGSSPVGVATATSTVTLTNTAGSDLRVTSLAIASVSVNPADFQIVAGGTCSSSTVLTAGQSCTTLVRFNPTATGSRSSLLRYWINTTNGHIDATLTGNGFGG
jgi:Protein of unknown function (DUF4038)/Putative collagen-binding domain of a collagenase